MTLREVYLVPMIGRNVLSVSTQFPITDKQLRYVNADWDNAFHAVGSRLEAGKVYLFVAHLHASSVPASFDAIRDDVRV